MDLIPCYPLDSTFESPTSGPLLSYHSYDSRPLPTSHPADTQGRFDAPGTEPWYFSVDQLDPWNGRLLGFENSPRCDTFSLRKTFRVNVPNEVNRLIVPDNCLIDTFEPLSEDLSHDLEIEYVVLRVEQRSDPEPSESDSSIRWNVDFNRSILRLSETNPSHTTDPSSLNPILEGTVAGLWLDPVRETKLHVTEEEIEEEGEDVALASRSARLILVQPHEILVQRFERQSAEEEEEEGEETNSRDYELKEELDIFDIPFIVTIRVNIHSSLLIVHQIQDTVRIDTLMQLTNSNENKKTLRQNQGKLRREKPLGDWDQFWTSKEYFRNMFNVQCSEFIPFNSDSECQKRTRSNHVTMLRKRMNEIVFSSDQRSRILVYGNAYENPESVFCHATLMSLASAPSNYSMTVQDWSRQPGFREWMEEAVKTKDERVLAETKKRIVDEVLLIRKCRKDFFRENYSTSWFYRALGTEFFREEEEENGNGMIATEGLFDSILPEIELSGGSGVLCHILSFLPILTNLKTLRYVSRSFWNATGHLLRTTDFSTCKLQLQSLFRKWSDPLFRNSNHSINSTICGGIISEDLFLFLFEQNESIHEILSHTPIVRPSLLSFGLQNYVSNEDYLSQTSLSEELNDVHIVELIRRHFGTNFYRQATTANPDKLYKVVIDNGEGVLGLWEDLFLSRGFRSNKVFRMLIQKVYRMVESMINVWEGIREASEIEENDNSIEWNRARRLMYILDPFTTDDFVVRGLGYDRHRNRIGMGTRYIRRERRNHRYYNYGYTYPSAKRDSFPTPSNLVRLVFSRILELFPSNFELIEFAVSLAELLPPYAWEMDATLSMTQMIARLVPFIPDLELLRRLMKLTNVCCRPIPNQTDIVSSVKISMARGAMVTLELDRVVCVMETLGLFSDLKFFDRTVFAQISVGSVLFETEGEFLEKMVNVVLGVREHFEALVTSQQAVFRDLFFGSMMQILNTFVGSSHSTHRSIPSRRSPDAFPSRHLLMKQSRPLMFPSVTRHDASGKRESILYVLNTAFSAPPEEEIRIQCLYFGCGIHVLPWRYLQFWRAIKLRYGDNLILTDLTPFRSFLFAVLMSDVDQVTDFLGDLKGVSESLTLNDRFYDRKKNPLIAVLQRAFDKICVPAEFDGCEEFDDLETAVRILSLLLRRLGVSVSSLDLMLRGPLTPASHAHVVRFFTRAVRDYSQSAFLSCITVLKDLDSAMMMWDRASSKDIQKLLKNNGTHFLFSYWKNGWKGEFFALCRKLCAVVPTNSWWLSVMRMLMREELSEDETNEVLRLFRLKKGKIPCHGLTLQPFQKLTHSILKRGLEDDTFVVPFLRTLVQSPKAVSGNVFPPHPAFRFSVFPLVSRLYSLLAPSILQDLAPTILSACVGLGDVQSVEFLLSSNFTEAWTIAPSVLERMLSSRTGGVSTSSKEKIAFISRLIVNKLHSLFCRCTHLEEEDRLISRRQERWRNYVSRMNPPMRRKCRRPMRTGSNSGHCRRVRGSGFEKQSSGKLTKEELKANGLQILRLLLPTLMQVPETQSVLIQQVAWLDYEIFEVLVENSVLFADDWLHDILTTRSSPAFFVTKALHRSPIPFLTDDRFLDSLLVSSMVPCSEKSLFSLVRHVIKHTDGSLSHLSHLLSTYSEGILRITNQNGFPLSMIRGINFRENYRSTGSHGYSRHDGLTVGEYTLSKNAQTIDPPRRKFRTAALLLRDFDRLHACVVDETEEAYAEEEEEEEGEVSSVGEDVEEEGEGVIVADEGNEDEGEENRSKQPRREPEPRRRATGTPQRRRRGGARARGARGRRGRVRGRGRGRGRRETPSTSTSASTTPRRRRPRPSSSSAGSKSAETGSRSRTLTRANASSARRGSQRGRRARRGSRSQGRRQ